MGLDMYLSKRTYVKNWAHHSPEQRTEITITKTGQPHPAIKTDRISEIVEEVAYWRKANQIHAWFVNNVQDGEDNCEEHYVDVDKLQELVDICKKVKESLLASPKVKQMVKTGWSSTKGDEYTEIEVFENTDVAMELLPPIKGFFFGSTEIGDWYMQDLDDTINQIEPLLSEPGNGSFYYYSSW